MTHTVFLEAGPQASSVPPQTAAVLYTLKHLRCHQLHITFATSTTHHSMPAPDLGDFSHDLVAVTELPHVVARCALPAVTMTGCSLIRCGLGCVLRCMVQVAHERQPTKNYIELLGFRGICLKSCAETSVWTKYVEIELPNVVNKLQELIATSCSQRYLRIPDEVVKLENHFHQPPIIPNIRRKRQQALKKLKNLGLSNPEGQDQQGSTPEELQHRYVEGTDLTLADLVLYPCISYIWSECSKYASGLHKQLPKISAWMKRMSNVPGIPDPCLHHRNEMVGLDPLQPRLLEVTLPTGDGVVLDIRDPNRKKFKAHLMEISQVLEKLKLRSISSSPREHPWKELRLAWDQMDSLVHPCQGDLPEKRVQKKCEQLENMIAAVRFVSRPGDVIVDFCAGGGHVGILAAYLLPKCQVIIIENKEESIRRAEERVKKLQLANVTLYQCNLDYFRGQFDIGVGLHACGVATDLILQCCLDNAASFVLCPCCYGKIQETHLISYPLSNTFRDGNITYGDCLTLGHAADQTAVDLPRAEQGKLCMQLVDTDRAALARQHGYDVMLCSMMPLTCSPKNNLLIGMKPRQNTSQVTNN